METTPKLAKPGAGLPWPKNWIARLTIPRMARKASSEWAESNFQKKARDLSRALSGLDSRQLDTKVLVPPLQGLEDSSRYWSVAMTLEHLIIVTESMVNIAVLLSKNESVPFEVDIAKVKPRQAIPSSEIVARFEEMIERVQNRLRTEIADRNSTATHRHPWFGRFTAHQWHWIAGVHLGIHLRQIREILARL